MVGSGKGSPQGKARVVVGMCTQVGLGRSQEPLGSVGRIECLEPELLFSVPWSGMTGRAHGIA